MPVPAGTWDAAHIAAEALAMPRMGEGGFINVRAIKLMARVLPLTTSGRLSS